MAHYSFTQSSNELPVLQSNQKICFTVWYRNPRGDHSQVSFWSKFFNGHFVLSILCGV